MLPNQMTIDLFIILYYKHYIDFLMLSSQKTTWSPEQDSILKKLYEEEGHRNWSIIAKTMLQQYHLPRKSAKQCRQRYQNHINLEVIKMDWTIEQELMLIHLHNDIGNKWSAIAQKIPGKTDNCVKNHFYSKLRKILRKLNAVIHNYFRKEFREIGMNVIYKIVEACQQQFKNEPNCDAQVSQACRQVQNKMLNLSMLSEEDPLDSKQRVSIYRQVIRQIYAISKMYKRKSKKSRNSSIQAPLTKNKKRKEVTIIQNPSERGYVSDSSSLFDQKGSFENRRLRDGDEFESMQFQSKGGKKKNEIVVKDEQEGIKDLLKDAGLLQYELPDMISLRGLKVSSRSSFKSYSQGQKNESQQLFFQESEIQKGFRFARKNSLLRNLDEPSD